MKKVLLRQSIGLIILALLLNLNEGAAQKGKVDSLKSLLPLKSAGEYVDVLFELGRAFDDYSESYEYMSQSYNMARTLNDTFRIVKTGRGKAQALRRLGRIESAIALYSQILPIAKRHNLIDEVKTILNGLGIAHAFQGRHDASLNYHFESLEIRTKGGNKREIQIALNNIGLVYQGLGNFKKALKYFDKALALSNDALPRDELGILLINIAHCKIQTKSWPEAAPFLVRAFDNCDEYCDQNFYVSAYYVSGLFSFEQGQFKKAEDSFLCSLELAASKGDSRYQLQNIEYLVKIYIARSEYSKVERYLNGAELLVKSGAQFSSEITNLYAQLYSIYLASKNYEKASFYQTKYINLRDSVFNEQLTTNLMKIEAENLERENRAKIESQNKILALNNDVIRTHKFLNIFVGVVALLLIALIVVLIKSNRLKQKHNMLLDKKVQERTHQLQLNHDSLQRASQERDILLQKISTDINTALVTLKGLCSLGMKDIQDPHALEYISKMNTTSESFSNILTKLHFIRSGAGTLK